ncbi:MAG: hypothetical protein V8S72_06125 [Oscillospiraceae bacterium]
MTSIVIGACVTAMSLALRAHLQGIRHARRPRDKEAARMTNILNYQHFPVYSVMVLFLGAFLIVMFAGTRPSETSSRFLRFRFPLPA